MARIKNSLEYLTRASSHVGEYFQYGGKGSVPTLQCQAYKDVRLSKYSDLKLSLMGGEHFAINPSCVTCAEEFHA